MPRSFKLLTLLLLACVFTQGQVDDAESAQYLVDYCTDNYNKKIGRGQCTDLIFYALSDIDKSLNNETRRINYKTEELKPGDIVHMEWKKGLKNRQHYMIVLEALEGAKVKIAHQNFNNQLKVVYTNYDLQYEKETKKREVSVYRLIN